MRRSCLEQCDGVEIADQDADAMSVVEAARCCAVRCCLRLMKHEMMDGSEHGSSDTDSAAGGGSQQL
jgi:hypothetical protein